MSPSLPRICIAVISLLLFHSGVGAAYGPEVWSNLGLYGGNVQTVVIDPSDPERLFAGIWFGEGLFRSDDGADTWQALKMEQRYEGEDTFENQVLLALALSPANPNVIWAAHNYWVAHSTDGGDTWTHIANSTVQRDCLNCGGWTDNFRFDYALASDPTDADTVYLGTAGAWSSYAGGAVYKTADGGKTWEKLNQGGNLDYVVTGLAVDPNTPSVLWAATTSYGVGGVWDGSLYRSTDGGQQWTPIEPKPFIGTGLNGVTPHPTDPDVVFVTAGGGVARGAFDGTGWQFTYPIEGCAQAFGLVFAPADTNIVYVGWMTPEAWGGDGRPKVSRSADGGLTWETTTVEDALASHPRTLAVHPTDPAILYLGDNSGGVLKSHDYGQTWTPVNIGINGVVVNDVAVDDNDTTHLIAATSGGVYERTGDVWQRRLSRNAESVSFVPGSSDAYYAGLWGDLARTGDGGTTWTINSKISDQWINDIAIDPADTQTLLIADYSHVRRSTDGGDSFEAVLEGLNQTGESYCMNTLAIDPADPRHIYAGGGRFTSPRVLGDLWESRDGGDTWARTGLTDVIVNKVLVDPADTSRLFAGCGYSDNIDTPLYKSTDAGATWTPAENGLPVKSMLLRAVWAASETQVYAAGGNKDILHVNGNVVAASLSGGTQQSPELQNIFGIDDTHIYAVGANGTILHFDGTTWNPMTSGTTELLYGIWGSSPEGLFAVGGQGTILHFEGTAWQAMASGTDADLYEVFGIGGNNLFATGEGGVILHYDGDAWSSMPSPVVNDLYGVWGSSGDAVFACGSEGTLIHFDGQVWESMDSGTSEIIQDMWGSADEDVYAVGHSGQILHYDGTTWSVSTIPDAKDLTGIWGLPNGVLFVVESSGGGIYRYDGSQWETLRPAGSRFRSVTDLAFNRSNTDILYASTHRAGVFLSPNRAGDWLNLGAPVLAVNAISAGSLYAATSGGLFQLTGTGVLAGDVFDRHSVDMLDNVSVTTDLGIGNRTIDGLYMMVLPAGEYDVYASADNYELGVAGDVPIFGADVTWVDFEMASVVTQMSTVPATNPSATIGSTGSGSYCFVGTITDSSDPLDSKHWTKWLFSALAMVLVVLLRRRREAWMAGLALICWLGLSSPGHSFTIFEQVGLASAPLPVGSGARAQGMGGAFIAVSDDATAASWNPAGLIQVERPEVSLVGEYVHRKEDFFSPANPEIDNTGSVSTSDINFVSATFPFHWHKNMVVSINYQRLFDFKREFEYQRNISAPAVDLHQQIRYDQDGFVSAIGFAGAIEITPRISLGATVNVWTDQMGSDNGWTENYNEIAEGSQAGVPVTINTTIQDRYEQFRGINFNIGLLWDIGNWGTIGAVVKTPFTATIQHRFSFSQTTQYGDPINDDNTTGPITVEEEVDLNMPISYGLGWSRRFQDVFTLGIDIYRTEWGDYCLTNGNGEEFSPIDGRPKEQSDVDATTHIRVGGEYLFLMPQHDLAVPVRFGLFYDPEPSEGSPNDVYGFALGAGLTFPRCSLDLAYQLRWADDADSGNLIAGSLVDITQQTLMASLIYYF
jgi:photosystem II stability/assembly factor-like uncharacterized protein/long-subunit fatty acid transport protein